MTHYWSESREVGLPGSPAHQRSLSEQDSICASSPRAALGSFAGTSRSRRQMPGAVPPSEKRRFRSQSSTVGPSSRRNSSTWVEPVDPEEQKKASGLVLPRLTSTGASRTPYAEERAPARKVIVARRAPDSNLNRTAPPKITTTVTPAPAAALRTSASSSPAATEGSRTPTSVPSSRSPAPSKLEQSRTPAPAGANEGASTSKTAPSCAAAAKSAQKEGNLPAATRDSAASTPAPAADGAHRGDSVVTPVTPALKTTSPRASTRLQPHPPNSLPVSTASGIAATPHLTGHSHHSGASTQQTQSNGTAEKAAIDVKAASPSFSLRNTPTVPPAVQPAIIRLFTSPMSLRNFGATCYLNSVVQCLLYTPGLLRALDKDRQRIIRDWETRKGHRYDEAHRRSCAERYAPAASSLLDLGTSLPRSETPASQLLVSLKAACAECNDEFAGNGQNDAHEFLITLLDVLDREVCRSKPESYQEMKDIEDERKKDAYARWRVRLRAENNSTIYDLFGGVTGSTVECATCSLISYRFEALLDISLPMAYNRGSPVATRTSAADGKNGKPRPGEVVAVDMLLNEMFFSNQGEFLSGGMQVTCDRCKKLRDKTIWTTIEEWPPIMVLHLKRFNNAGVKNESAVIFPYTFRPLDGVRYQLYGVCCHRGTSSFGHYTSYVCVDAEETPAAAGPLVTSAVACEISEPSYMGDTVGSTGGPTQGRRKEFERSPLLTLSGRSAEPTKDNGERADSTSSCAGKSTRPNGKASSKGGQWYLCNDENITAVTEGEVCGKTKEAYILFYRRVDEAQ